MNSSLLTLFIIAFLSAPAIGQEQAKPDLTRPQTPSSQPDTSIQSGDQPSPDAQAGSDPAGQTNQTGAYIPLWESDTIVHGLDSVPLYVQAPLVQGDTAWAEPDFSHSASKALMYALVLPGLGQAYNQKYWKMPIVWLALGGAGYAISYNSKNYQLASESMPIIRMTPMSATSGSGEGTWNSVILQHWLFMPCRSWMPMWMPSSIAGM